MAKNRRKINQREFCGGPLPADGTRDGDEFLQRDALAFEPFPLETVAETQCLLKAPFLGPAFRHRALLATWEHAPGCRLILFQWVVTACGGETFPPGVIVVVTQTVVAR